MSVVARGYVKSAPVCPGREDRHGVNQPCCDGVGCHTVVRDTVVRDIVVMYGAYASIIITIRIAENAAIGKKYHVVAILLAQW